MICYQAAPGIGHHYTELIPIEAACPMHTGTMLAEPAEMSISLWPSSGENAHEVLADKTAVTQFSSTKSAPN
jgi:hypothetical protein